MSSVSIKTATCFSWRK